MILAAGLLSAALCVPTLRQAFIYTRHGARAPFVQFPKDRGLWNCGQEELISPMTRNDEIQRPSPGAALVYDVSNTLRGTCYVGQLTHVGLRENEALGARWFERYSLLTGLVGESFNPEEIRLRSTDIPRVKQSLTAQLRGMYGSSLSMSKDAPFVHVPEKDKDPLADQSACTGFSKNQAYLYKKMSPIISEYSDRLRQVVDALGYVSEEEDTEYDTWAKVWDNLITRTWLGMALPRQITRQDVLIGGRVADLTAQMMYCNDNPEVSLIFTRARIGPYLTELLDLIGSSERLHITAAHDTTIMPLMAAFAGRGWDCSWPPYASHIELQIWQDGDIALVRLYYQNHMVVPVGCETTVNCRLEAFLEALRMVAVPYEEWNVACEASIDELI
ncbi:Acid phosphatase [Giardia muris]|uniref:Acid phosphatase n=1 Tax=Giardia muris TaxID=5742 RepID=A0A4Z1T969_GIAMU|nr:Acid phosphatase [Giardia muris]|eukprot:TNJ29061.1 Acid phosphatase [Giardia muris]